MSVISVEGFEVYTSIIELPVDGCDPTLDVGDIAPELRPLGSKLSPPPPMELVGAELVKSMKRRRRLIVPLRRVIKKEMRGPDVKMVFRALSKWEHRHGYGAYHDNPTPLYGPGKVKRMKHFQHAHGLKADGQYGEKTHHAMLPFFDAHGARVMQRFHPQKVNLRRAESVWNAIYCIAHCGPHYTQNAYWRSQGFYQHKKPHLGQTWQYADCSAFVMGDCYWPAGVTGCGPYDGWTGSMWDAMRRVSWADAKPGDAVMYENHTAILLTKEDGGRVATDGHEGGPFNERKDYRGDILGYLTCSGLN